MVGLPLVDADSHTRCLEVGGGFVEGVGELRVGVSQLCNGRDVESVLDCVQGGECFAGKGASDLLLSALVCMSPCFSGS